MPFLIFPFFLGLAFFFSVPLWTSGSALIPGGQEDTLLFLWNAWWGHQAWMGAVPHLYETQMLFHPFGASLITHDMPLWMLVVTDSVQALHGSLLLSVNLWFVLTWALNGFCTYLLAREVTGLRAPALVAGLYVMTHAYTLARAMENWGQFDLFGLPLFLWLLIRARSQASTSRGIAAGLALAWTAACHYYFFVYALMIWLAVMFWDHSPWQLRFPRLPVPSRARRRVGLVLSSLSGLIAAWIIFAHPAPLFIHGQWIGLESPSNALLVFWLSLMLTLTASRGFCIVARLPQTVRPFRGSPHGSMAAAAFIGLLPLLWKAVPLCLNGNYPRQHVLWKTHNTGANLWALFSPNPLNAVWGAGVSRWFTHAALNPQEEASMIGWTCLAVIFFSRVWRANPRIQRWLAIALGATLFSMGVYLHIGALNTWCPLPFYVARLLPLLENVRIPERWMAVGAVAWAVVLAAALVRIARDRSWPLHRVSGVIAVLILLENWPGIPYVRPPAVSPIYETLRQQPAGAVLPLPLYVGDSSIGAGDALPTLDKFPWINLWAQIHYEKPMVGGYIGRIPRRLLKAYTQDPFWGRLIHLEEGDSTPASDPTSAQIHQAVQGQEIRYCLLHRSALRPAALAFIQRTLPLQPIATDGDVELYRITD